MKKNNKTIASIIAFTAIIATAIITSDVAANVKMLLLILTIPFAIGGIVLLASERTELEVEAPAVVVDDVEVAVDVKVDDEDEELSRYVDEWKDSLQIDVIDDEYVARMKRYRQIQDIHQEIHEMAMEADRRIAELCGMI